MTVEMKVTTQVMAVFNSLYKTPPTPKKRGKTRKTRGRNHLDMTCFQTVPVEVMDEMPWDIDGK